MTATNHYLSLTKLPYLPLPSTFGYTKALLAILGYLKSLPTVPTPTSHQPAIHQLYMINAKLYYCPVWSWVGGGSVEIIRIKVNSVWLNFPTETELGN